MNPRLTFTKSWYGFSQADADVVLRAFEEPETVKPEDHLDLDHKPATMSPLIDRVLLLAVVADLLAETMRTVSRLHHRVDALEAHLRRLRERAVERPGATEPAEEDDDEAYQDGPIGAGVAEPPGQPL